MTVLQLKDRGQDVFNQLSEVLRASDLPLFGLSVVKGLWFPFVYVHLLTQPFPVQWFKGWALQKTRMKGVSSLFV